MKLAKQILGGVLALCLSAAPAFAEPYDPTGIWEATDGESRYDVTLCGDGTQLCAKLIWIRPDVTNDRNRQYLGTWVVNQANRVSDTEWQGTISLYGLSVGGSVSKVGDERLRVRGCALFVICENKVAVKIADSMAEYTG